MTINGYPRFLLILQAAVNGTVTLRIDSQIIWPIHEANHSMAENESGISDTPMHSQVEELLDYDQHQCTLHLGSGWISIDVVLRSQGCAAKS